MQMPPSFDEKKFLENLLLDEHRDIYNKMTAPEKALLRKAYLFGFMTSEAAK